MTPVIRGLAGRSGAVGEATVASATWAALGLDLNHDLRHDLRYHFKHDRNWSLNSWEGDTIGAYREISGKR